MSRKNLALHEKIDILFEYARYRGQSTTYRAIALATGETQTNIHKIHRGENTNPGLQTVQALARYFGVGLGYFDCETRDECLRYLKGVDEQSLQEVAMRAEGVSNTGLEAIRQMIEYVREKEGLTKT